MGTGFAASNRGEPGATRGEDGAGLVPRPPPATATRGEDGDARGEPRGDAMRGEPMRGEPMRGRLGEVRAGAAGRRSRIPGPTGDPPTCGGCQEHMPVKTTRPDCRGELTRASESHYTALTDMRRALADQ